MLQSPLQDANSGQLIPGMGGMNPTGSDPLNPISTMTPVTGPYNVPASLSTGSGVATPNAPIGIGVGDSSNLGLTPGVTTVGGGATTVPGTSGFPANTAGTVGGAGTSGIGDLNLGSLLGFNINDPNLASQLNNMFGSGVGTALMNFLGGGAGYNPQIATALINQMAPQEERTRNQILESFGASGGRYSSPAGIGLADYESSYSLGQQGILANLANQATDRYSNLFSGLIDTAYLTQANKLSPWNIISGIIGLLGNTGIKIPGIPGIPGSTGPQGQPGKTGPTGPTTTTPTTPTKQGNPSEGATATSTYTDYNTGMVQTTYNDGSVTWTDPTSGNIYNSSGGLIESPSGQGNPFGTTPFDPFGTGGTELPGGLGPMPGQTGTPYQYTGGDLGGPGDAGTVTPPGGGGSTDSGGTDFFGSGFDDFFGA